MGRWQRYWFAEGGRLAAAMVRIGIASSVLLTLWRLATLSTVHLPGPPELYRPVGVWMLLGHAPPPGALVTAMWVLAWGGSFAMLLGLATRAATAVSFVGAVSIASLSFASSATWSHQYNVVFLAQVAFLGARGGDTLSIDALIRRFRGLPAENRARAYQWSLRLVQLAVALMFAGAALHKILHGHFTLRWALSDNLRHQLLVRYDLAGLPRPAVAAWIIDDVWKYRTAAVLNLISQATPILACIFVRRPLVRALGGMFFVVETLALGFVINLWNLHWLPLVAVFVDWDRLFRLPVPAESAVRPSRGARVWVIVFIVYDAITAIIPTLDQRLNTYPFSAFPMFATVRARAPYDEHLPYTVPGDHFVAIADVPLDESAQRWLDHTNRRLETVRDPEVLHKKLAAILADLQARYPDNHVHGLRHYLTIFEAPAYPAPAHFEPHEIAVTGELLPDGTFRTLLGSLDPQSVTMRPRNLDAAGAKLVVYRNDELAPLAIAAPAVENRFATGALDGDPLYAVALVDGTPWLVASRKAWRWE